MSNRPGAPTGRVESVALLFTDIEGSARLWEAHSEAMDAAIARHDAILHDAVVVSGGSVFKSLGDGCRAAFPSVREAVAAAVRAQMALVNEPWPAGTPIRVRMAIHCGEAVARSGDYFGQTLNRCARLETLAHGGQVLLSGAAHAAVRDRPPANVSFVFLGEHALRDLTRAERVYQLAHPDLDAEFPPLRSGAAPRGNLPRHRTRFVGRGADVAEVTRLLETSPLVSLVGPPGTGKTRLALEVGAAMAPRWRDGAWWVDVAALGEPAQVVPAVAAALKVGERPGESMEAVLVEAVQARELLLVLDNCEHLIGACARVAERLLSRCPRVTILATSREPLGIAGERVHRVAPLPFPPEEADPSPEAIGRYEAVQLFVDRGRTVEPEFSLGPANAAQVAEICRRLDGIPLALELAAARLTALSATEIAERLDQRFRLLVGGSRVAVPRQQTLRAAIDWSYDLLDSSEKAALSRLGVFAAPCTLDAAEAVCGGADVAMEDVLDVVTRLAAKSMVTVVRRSSGTRYGMTQTMREYARQQLLARGETEAVRDRHLAYWCRQLESMEGLPNGPRLPGRLARLDLEHDDVRAALRWAEARGRAAEAATIAATMAQYWTVRGHWSAGREILTAVLARAEDLSPAQEADALVARGGLALHLGEVDEASRDFARSLDIRRSLGDARGMGGALNGLGNAAYARGRIDAAESLYLQSLERYREAGDPLCAAGVLANLGNVAFRRGDLGTAEDQLSESLRIRREMGDLRGTASALHNLGNVAFHRGELDAARAHHEESLALRREYGDKSGEATSLLNLATVLWALGELEPAAEAAEESLALSRGLSDPVGIAYSLCTLAEAEVARGDFGHAVSLLEDGIEMGLWIGDSRVLGPALNCLASAACGLGDHEAAAHILAAADAHRARAGGPTSSHADRQASAVLERCRGALGERRMAEAQAAGAAMGPREALALVVGRAASSDGRDA